VHAAAAADFILAEQPKRAAHSLRAISALITRPVFACIYNAACDYSQVILNARSVVAKDDPSPHTKCT
jgi:hypothetical protein